LVDYPAKGMTIGVGSLCAKAKGSDPISQTLPQPLQGHLARSNYFFLFQRLLPAG